MALPGIDIPDIPIPDFFPSLPNLVPDTKDLDDKLRKDKKMKLSQAIETYTGWRGEDARIAKAVILAESGGNPGIDNGQCCIGLMQLNYLVHRGKWGSPKDLNGFKEWASNPANNLRAGYALWKDVGGKWSHPGVIGTWEVLANGSFRTFLNSSEDPEITIDKNTLTGAVGDAAGAVADAALGPVDEFIGALLSGDVWFRIAKFGGGVALILIGGATLAAIALNKSGAANVIPAGKVAKVAKTGARTGAKNVASKIGRPSA